MFCRIVAGELPADIVARSPLAIAFRDLDPKAPTHVLVVPAEHVVDAAALGPEHGDLLAEMAVMAREAAEVDGVAERGYRLVFNIGNDAGNTVPHLHLHVLGGRSLAWPPG